MPETTRREQEIRRSFLAALVLTGSASDAEAAVIEAIATLKPPDDSLLLLSIAAAPRFPGFPRRADEDRHLAQELERLFSIPMDLRRCFVLRILAGVPRELCAELLHLHVEAVDELAGAGAREQAKLSVVDSGLGLRPLVSA